MTKYDEDPMRPFREAYNRVGHQFVEAHQRGDTLVSVSLDDLYQIFGVLGMYVNPPVRIISVRRSDDSDGGRDPDSEAN